MLINQALCSQEIWLEENDNNFSYNYNEIKKDFGNICRIVRLVELENNKM